MEAIPESWPPETEGERRVAPLFALPQVWLFPSVVLPLHIFEERYRKMIEDSLDGPGRIVLGTIEEGREEDVLGVPPVYPIAGLGEIGRHERLADGCFNIWLVGLHRVRIQEVESDSLYRKVEVERAEEIMVRRDEEETLRKELVDAILERTEDLTTIPPQVPASHLADLLILRMPLPHEVLNDLYSELDSEKRARQALSQHTIRPKVDPGSKGEDSSAD